jgi:hypothetical protein
MKTTTTIPFLLLGTSLCACAAHMSDHFANRPRVTGATETVTAETSAATLEFNEPRGMHGGNRGRSAWCEWVAPASGWLTIDTAGSFSQAVLAIYTGDSIETLRTVARAKYTGSQTPSNARFPVTAGTIYQIALDGDSYSSSSSGSARVNFRLTPSEVPPCATGTDRFFDRGNLAGHMAYGVANNEPATLDPFQPKHTGNPPRDVWWEWTAPATGLVTLDTLECATDTVITVFSGDPSADPPFSGLDLVASNDDIPNSESSRVRFQTEAGRTYQIAVNGSSYSDDSTDNIILKLDLVDNSQPGAVPGTDHFIHRPDLTGLRAIGVACNIHATTEAFEPNARDAAGRTVWWSWTAPESRAFQIDTFGSENDTLLRIYQGDVLETLALVESNDDVSGAKWSRLTLNAVRGMIYQIRVESGSYRNWDLGNITLNLNPVPTPEIDIRLQGSSSLADGRSKVNFGKARRGFAPAVRIFVIRNTGSAPLTGVRVLVAGRHAADFAVIQPGTISLAPGQSVTFRTLFRPKALGSRVARISVLSNDSDESPFDIAVGGNGVVR